ncbi:methyltransferase domain-containing protein [Candidatus Saccharibacteria bacterium]|nr:methyltransferase domain-containing protein [Candidatus Saccharibacteria bacterium]
MYLVILGRQPALGLAELEAVFGSERVFDAGGGLAFVEAEEFDVERFGGVKKAGRVVLEVEGRERKVVEKIIYDTVLAQVGTAEGKVTLGLSSYMRDFGARDLQKIGLTVRKEVKRRGGSLRLIPNEEAELSTATSHHSKLGLSPKKIEMMVARVDGKIIVARSVGAQNISSYAARDQKRPARDMYVGMLPPKLAKVIVNLACEGREGVRVLDPFCGTGVVLQEAVLMGYGVVGADLSEKMIDYSRRNLEWLEEVKRRKFDWKLAVGDAMKVRWDSVDVVACETYLGQPFSAVPEHRKMVEVAGGCKHVISGFLKNLAKQTKPGTRVCVAVPMWKRNDGSFYRLNLLDSAEKLGYNAVEFKNVKRADLVYYRENQIVGRELLVLVRR